MSELTRRGFLGAAAAVGGAAALGAALPSAVAQALPAHHQLGQGAKGRLSDVKHIVVLMQENRSFDHYFGSLRGVRGFGDRSTIKLSSGHSVFNQPVGSGTQYPWPLRASTGTDGTDPETLAQCNGGVAHSWGDQHAAWNQGQLDGWYTAKGIGSLGYLDRSDIPFHYALADAYTICDAYHCSALSATGPNRTYLWSGMIDPRGTAGGPAYNGGDESGLKWTTYAETLQSAGISWKVYQDANDNYGDNGLQYFSQFSNAKPGSALYDAGMGTVSTTGLSNADALAGAVRKDVLAGTLPQVSWVVTNQAFSEHPDGPPSDGAHYLHGILEALNADPDVLNSTAVFINYDENDGFFDHVPPPIPPAGTADEFVLGAPIGLGFRVPMVIVSPWTRGGWVSSEVFDHTSVIQFMETWSASIGKPARCSDISDWRRSVTGDLTNAFDFCAPIHGLPPLPGTSAVIGAAACGPLPKPTPTSNALPIQEAGAKPARSLPYQPNANLGPLVFGLAGGIQAVISLSNLGANVSKSSQFAVYANTYRQGGPWQYTVDPVKRSDGLSSAQTASIDIGALFGAGKYDLTVIGPNRFLREFSGDANSASKDLVVAAAYYDGADCSRPGLWLQLTNHDSRALTCTVVSANYSTDRPRTYRVEAHGEATHRVDPLARSHGWYDLMVTCDNDPLFTRRFVGHLENGKPSITG